MKASLSVHLHFATCHRGVVSVLVSAVGSFCCKIAMNASQNVFSVELFFHILGESHASSGFHMVHHF
jgi:hypothetical protein